MIVLFFRSTLDHEDLEALLSKVRGGKSESWVQTQVERTTEQYAPGGEVLLTALTALHNSLLPKTLPMVLSAAHSSVYGKVDFECFTEMLCCPPWRELLPR